MQCRVSGTQFKSLAQPVAGLVLWSSLFWFATPAGNAKTPINPPSSLMGATPPVVPATLPSAPAVENAYTLGAGDRIRIEVFRVAQYSGEQQVLVDGTLNLPQIGTVPVQGLTLKQAADAISARYSSLLRYPLVTVSLIAPRPIKVGIAGEVNRPGSYVVPVAGTQLPTITQAIQLAGGITQAADLRNVQIRRPNLSGADQIIAVNLWEFLQTGNLRQDITLRGDDTVFIPPAANVNLVESAQIATASFAGDKSQPLNIAVVGEVYRPGPHIVTGAASTGAAGETGQADGAGSRPPTVTRAIQVAGGVRPMANVREIQVRRTTKSGVEQVITVDLWKLLQSGDISQDLILQDRDTVVIPIATAVTPEEATRVASASFSPDSIRINITGEVKQPGVLRLPPNTPLNQALLAAGGFNIRARRRSVELVRLNTDGTVTRRSINVDFTKGVDEQVNPGLRNDDIVIVNRSPIAALSDTLGTITNPLGSFLSIFSIFNLLR
jgi:polysaccharide export outer membrane protein